MSALPPAAPADRPALREATAFACMVRAAMAGDAHAWHQLVGGATPIVRRVARGFQLAPADVDDVVQNTWHRAFERLHTLRQPEAFAGWLAVTARREALRLLQGPVRELLVDDMASYDSGEDGPLEASLVARERDDALHRAVARLPERQRRLLSWMLEHPDACYAEVSTALEMPIGAIGPTRERALARLRRDVQLTAVAAA